MSTVYDDTLAAVLARLQGSPMVVPNDNVARSHQTAVPREESPAVRVVDGLDKPLSGKGCDTRRSAEFMVRIIVRGDSDSASSEAWGYAQDVLERLSPATPYASGVTLECGEIRPDREVADLDVYALDMEFRIDYTAGAWSLEAPA